MTLDLEHLDTVIDSVTISLMNHKEVAEEATTDLLRLGCHLLSLGRNILDEGGLQRADLDAAIVTAETITEGHAADATPSLRPLADTLAEQLETVRDTIVENAGVRDQGTPRYAAVLASLDSFIAAVAGLRALLSFVPALLPADAER